MNEYLTQTIFSLQIVWLAVFTLLYGFGGIHNNWLRRFVGTAWMMFGVWVFSVWQHSWNLWYLTFLPIAIGSMVIGYGKGDLPRRVGRRAAQGSAMACCPLAMVIINHAWGAWFFNIGLCLTTCIVIGGLNVFGNARKNETLVAALCFILVLFLVSKP